MWNQSLDKVLRDFGVSAKWLSKQTGISETMISQFRKGHRDTTTNTLNKLLQPLPFEAKEKFFCLVLGGHLPPAQCPTVEELIKDLPRERKKKLAIILVEAIAKEPSEKPSLEKVH